MIPSSPPQTTPAHSPSAGWTARYRMVRQESVERCAPLRPEDHVPQAAVFVSPAKWHLAHTTWFFEEFVLNKHLPDYRAFNPDFGYLFNSYYQSVGVRALRQNRGLITRPDVAEVHAYRHYVDQHMEQWLPQADPQALALVELGLQHEQQHQELLLSDIKYLLFQNPTYPAYRSGSAPEYGHNTESGTLTIGEGMYTIGYAGKDFCFDNELAKHKVYCAETVLSRELVTHAAYLEFIRDGAYRDFRLWLDEGWQQLQASGRQAPLYWVQQEDTWFCYTLAGLQPLDPQAMVCHVSFYEAAAFATWAGMRLPTEFEWEVAQAQFSWGSRWEWTHSAYLPYPGFQPAAGAVGEYNGKFMMNQMVLRGASLATPAGHSRATYRNFFPPDAAWQFSGIRLARR